MRQVTEIEVELEAEEWYVLCNWLRDRENRLMYALRPRSEEWATVRDLRAAIDAQRDCDRGRDRDRDRCLQRVTLSRREWAYLVGCLRRRSRRLLIRPWRDRERRDVRHLRDHLLVQLDLDAGFE